MCYSRNASLFLLLLLVLGSPTVQRLQRPLLGQDDKPTANRSRGNRRDTTRSESTTSGGARDVGSGLEGGDAGVRELTGACISSHLNYLAFFPCTECSSHSECLSDTIRHCDVFLYPAVLLAMDHINSDPRVLHYPEHAHNNRLYNTTDTDIRLVVSETRVCVRYHTLQLKGIIIINCVSDCHIGVK